MKTLIALVWLLLNALYSTAQSKPIELVIQTSAVCGMCKEKIESAVFDLKGIREAELNLADSRIAIQYIPSKVTAEEIRMAISAAGYDADAIHADTAAYNQLPLCCRKEAGKH